MKKRVAGALVGALLVTPAMAVDQNEQWVKESRGAVKQLFKSLSGTLVAAMKAGGPSQAIAACNINAQPITQNVSSQLGLDVARTSLRLRNPKNEADAWEIKVLQQFEARKAAGEELMKMDYHEVVESGGKRQFRYMKAIPAGKPHGLPRGVGGTRGVEEDSSALPDGSGDGL